MIRRRVKAPARVALGHGTVVAVAGVGQACAARAAKGLLAGGAEALVSWGSAGGLDPALSPGALLLPEAVIEPDGGSHPVSKPWRDALAAALSGQLTVDKGRLLSTHELVASRAEKGALFRSHAVAAVDTESTAVAAAAHAAGVPFLAVRAIADPADGRVPQCIVAAVDREGRVVLAKLGFGLLRRPHELIDLLRTARWFGAAIATLAIVSATAGPALLCGSAGDR